MFASSAKKDSRLSLVEERLGLGAILNMAGGGIAEAALVGVTRVSTEGWLWRVDGPAVAEFVLLRVVSEPKRANSGKAEAKAVFCIPSGLTEGKRVAVGSGTTAARSRSLSFALAARNSVL